VCGSKPTKQRRNKVVLGDMQGFADPQRHFSISLLSWHVLGYSEVITALKLKI